MTTQNKFKVTFRCNQKQLGDILVALAPYKVSDFDFGLVVDVPYSENNKRASGITAHITEMLSSVTSVSREAFNEKLLAMGFNRAKISSAITRLKAAKKIKVTGDTIQGRR